MTKINRALLVMVAAMTAMTITAFTPRQAADDQSEGIPWEAVDLGQAVIAVPRGWRNLDNRKTSAVMYRVGTGIRLPPMDDTRTSLQVFMSVERVADVASLEDLMDRTITALKAEKGLEIIGQETIQNFKLAGTDTDAKLMKAEFMKNKNRRNLQMKLVVKEWDNKGWVVSLSLIGGAKSKWVSTKSGMAQWLEAHVRSFNLEKKQFDEAALTAAYRDRTWN